MIEPLLLPGEEEGRGDLVREAVGCGYGEVVSVGVNSLPEGGRFRGVLVRKGGVDSARGVINGFSREADLVVLDASRSGLGSLHQEGGLDLVTGLAGGEYLHPDLLSSLRRAGVGLVFDLSPVVSSRRRFGRMKRMLENAERCRKTGCRVVPSVVPGDPFELRGPREVEALSELCGVTGEQFDEGQTFLEGVLDG